MISQLPWPSPCLPRLCPAPAHPGSLSRHKLGDGELAVDFLPLTLKTAEVEREKQPSLLHKILSSICSSYLLLCVWEKKAILQVSCLKFEVFFGTQICSLGWARQRSSAPLEVSWAAWRLGAGIWCKLFYSTVWQPGLLLGHLEVAFRCGCLASSHCGVWVPKAGITRERASQVEAVLPLLTWPGTLEANH